MIQKVIEKLRIERHTQRMTIESLSDKSGVSKKHISNVENHKAKPSIQTLEKLADGLGIEINLDIALKASGE